MPFKQHTTAKETHKKKTLGGAPWCRDNTATAHTGGTIHSMAVLGYWVIQDLGEPVHHLWG